jgi:hypothetical protein
MKNIGQRLENQFSSTLLALLDDMFASCDDLYFDLASRASSNVEQNLYFESMREVRVKTRTGRSQFQLNLGQTLAALHKAKSLGTKETTPDSEELGIIADDELELDVAVKSMVTRARAVTKKPLFELRCRLQSLYKISNLGEEENPYDPGSLIAQFVSATEHINIEIKARIILLKQFERIIISRLPEIYSKANKLLEDNGIQFKRPKQTKIGSGQKASPFARNADSENESFLNDSQPLNYQYSNPTFNELTSLLGRLRNAPVAGSPEFPLFSSPDGARINNAELLSLLDSSQSQTMATQQGSIDLRAILQSLLNQPPNADGPVAVEQFDEDIINLVAMFFDFVLDDQNVPDNVKALISRLQMPVLKIALKDKQFFSDDRHQARQFINEIVRISIGITDDSPAAKDLYENLEGWVHDIQTQTGDIESSFEASLTELTAYNKQIEKRAELIEKRTNENAKGQARKQLAKIKTQQAIKESLDGKKISRPVAEFIVELWQQALYIALAKHGEESSEWLSGLQTMQDLIWCARKHDDQKSKQRYASIRAELDNRLQQGLQLTTLNEAQTAAQIAQICKLLDRIAAPPKPTTDGNDSSSKPVPAEETFEAQKDDRLEAANAQKNWSEMTALERQQQKLDALTYEFIEKAEKYPVGSWFEFKVASSGTVLRCKLAAKLEGSDNYIFVNRFGFKTLEKARKEFAYDLQRNRARPLRTGPIFERSLQKMVDRLRSVS